MKKLFSLLLLLVLLISFVHSSSFNGQKIYPIDSEEYEAIKYIYLSSGKALPSTAGPWSASELKLMLSRINQSSLEGYSKELYQWVDERISIDYARFNVDDIFKFTISMDVGLRAGAHINTKDFNHIDDVYTEGTGDWNKQLPMFAFPLETWFGNNIYGFSQFELGVDRTLAQYRDVNYLHLDENNDSLLNEHYSNNYAPANKPIGYNLMCNIMFVPPAQMDDFNVNFPFRAFGSLGGDWWNIQIGRDKLSWGAGESGNLLLGDHVLYHNQLRFTAFSNKFKYTFVTSLFPHPDNYTYEKDGKDYISLFYDQDSEKTGTKAFIGHRLEWRILDKLGMSISEAIMYQSDTHLDLMYLSPTAVFHNFYIRHNANSTLTIEADFAVKDNLNIYAQFLVDDINMPGENNAVTPNALGIILGTKGATPYNNGMIYGSVEAAYTTPFTYLRDDGSRKPYNYGLNYIVAIPEFVTGNGMSNYDLTYLGYRYGNDAIVANLKLGYKVFDKWFTEGTFRYMAHGTYDMNTRWGEIDPAVDTSITTPTFDHPSTGSYIEGVDTSKRNAVSHTFTLSLKGGVTITDNFDFNSELTFISILNKGNIYGKTASDLQAEVSFIYSI